LTGLTRADAQQNVVRLIVALPQIVDVVGRDEREIQLARQRHDTLDDGLLLLDALILHLEEEVVWTENVPQTRRGFERRSGLLDPQRARHFALETTAQTDQAS
jgi:hypothetical protein